MKRGLYAKGEMKLYQFRNCPHCGNHIPKVTRTGNPIRASKYLDLKTCGGSLCVKKEKGWILPIQSPITTSPIDRFLYPQAENF